MTPDQRMREALADLQAQLECGVRPETALAEAAGTYGFKVEVVAKRAGPLGPLDQVEPKAVARAERNKSEAKRQNAVRDFCTEALDGVSFDQWMMERVGRLPTSQEEGEAFDACANYIISEMLKAGKITRASH